MPGNLIRLSDMSYANKNNIEYLKEVIDQYAQAYDRIGDNNEYKLIETHLGKLIVKEEKEKEKQKEKIKDKIKEAEEKLETENMSKEDRMRNAGIDVDYPNTSMNKTNDGVKVANLIMNLAALCEHFDISVRYNMMNKRIEIDNPTVEDYLEQKNSVDLTNIENMARKQHMPDTNIPAYLEVIASQNAYHPVRDWIEAERWDGNSRLEAFYNTITSAHPMKKTLLFKWMLSAMKSVFTGNKPVKSEGVLILYGKQGLGKTEWFNALCPIPSAVKAGAQLNVKNKDSVIECLMSWIVELGEIESVFQRRELSELKAFITLDKDTYRSPYGKTSNDYIRRTVFCGSVNNKEFLSDTTGNRRFWVLNVDAIDYSHKINMQQVWAEIYHMFAIQGISQHWLGVEEQIQIAKETAQFEMVVPVHQVLEDHHVRQLIRADKQGHKIIQMSASYIYKKITGKHTMTRSEIGSVGQWLEKHNIFPNAGKKYSIQWNMPDRDMNYLGQHETDFSETEWEKSLAIHQNEMRTKVIPIQFHPVDEENKGK